MTRAVPIVLVGLLLALTAVCTAGTATPGVEVSLTIENHRFQPEELRAAAGIPFVLVITNKDATPEEFESHDLRIEKVIPGGKTLRLRMPALKPGTYPFVGEFHESTAKGRLIIE